MHSGGMQIVEVTDFGVRSAVLRLTRRDTPLRFEIFPMVHVGEAAFYDAVTERLRRCDLIVAEGIGRPESPGAPGLDADLGLDWPGLELNDPAAEPRDRKPWRWDAVSALTAGYRIPARFERFGLVEQNIDYDALGVPVLYPDLTDAEFAAGWRAVPAWQRAVALAAGPLVALDRLAFGSRRSLARGLEVSDTDWRERLAGSESMDDLLELIGDQRDRLLMTALDAVHDRCSGDAITVAVVYGAAHVPPVTHGLRSLHGYSVRGAEWLTIFGLDQPRA